MKQPNQKSDENPDEEIRKLLEKNKNLSGALKKILKSLNPIKTDISENKKRNRQ